MSATAGGAFCPPSSGRPTAVDGFGGLVDEESEMDTTLLTELENRGRLNLAGASASHVRRFIVAAVSVARRSRAPSQRPQPARRCGSGKREKASMTR